MGDDGKAEVLRGDEESRTRRGSAEPAKTFLLWKRQRTTTQEPHLRWQRRRVLCIRLVGSRRAVYLSVLGNPAGPLEHPAPIIGWTPPRDRPELPPSSGRPAVCLPFRGIT
ncbi:hypothetical protein VTN00DRAFT_924 [Thermoascus crustaceus]|uniref:uncharacterized protein n=1 Tax=Thermoascus crustaceus TaxID=5088 RepID=UPI0037430A5B